MSFLVLLFLCSACSHRSEDQRVKSDQKEWMESFFTEVLLHKSGIFTLWGSKPITTIPLYFFSEEEVLQFYENLSEEEKTKTILLEEYNLPRNWKNWIEVSHQFDIRQFYFFVKEDSDDPKISTIFLVNIKSTIEVLTKNYELFRARLGYDFDPAAVVSKIKERKSAFWDTVLDDPLLLGILYGYGKQNAFAFYWKHIKAESLSETLTANISDIYTPGISMISMKNYPIPIFASFVEEDPMICRYQKEKRQIQEKYKGRDFLLTTLERLESSF